MNARKAETENQLRSYIDNMDDEIEWGDGEKIDIGLRRRPPEDFFLAGPIPLGPIVALGRLRGKVLLVWLLIWHRVAYTKHPKVTLPDYALKAWGISQDAKADALKRLVADGWVETRRIPGGYLKVQLTGKSCPPTKARHKGNQSRARANDS
jgi:hypothetical protein